MGTIDNSSSDLLKLSKRALDLVFEPVWTQAMNRDIQDFTAVPGALKGVGFYCNTFPTLRMLMPSMTLTDRLPAEGCQYAFLWGNGHHAMNASAVGVALESNVPMIICEGGWLLSADTWANSKAPDRYRYGCSMVMDSRGSYYDATRVSTVEMMLNDPSLTVSASERDNARRIMRRIVENKLSKYNHQPVFVPEIGRPGRRKVLVVDQSYGDYAIRKGWADETTFEKMLKAAIDENPEADVLVKTHPDTMTGTRRGYYDRLVDHDNVYRVTMPINPYSLLELVDKVYVCSTQFGFEALMAGKEVHVFGMPFYAGWGVTVDDQRNPRRTNRRTLEEIFHIFYLRYTHWVNPDTGRPCSIDESIDWLLGIRDEYSEYRKKHADEKPATSDDRSTKVANWLKLKAAEAAKADLWTRLKEAEKSKGELWTRLKDVERLKDESWQKFQAAEAAKGELWQRLQTAEAAKAEQWQRLQAAEVAKGELWQRLQEADGVKAEQWQRLQAAEAAKGELWQKLQAAEAAKGELWQKLQAAEAAKTELYGRLQKKEARRLELERVLEQVAKVI